LGRRLGLLIGINHYQDSAFQPLHYAETDATIFARWLTNPRGGNWPSSDIFSLTGAKATTQQVESLIAQLCLQAAEPDDLILIYFAGHAFLDEASGDGMLACANTSFHEPTTALHLPSLIPQVIVPSRAAQVIVFLDCFQSGHAWNARRATLSDFHPLVGPSSITALQQAPGRVLYCSCRGNDFAPETGEQGLGGFMYGMIVAMSGPAMVHPGQLTLQQLHAYLSASLPLQIQPQVFGQNAAYDSPIVLIGEAPALASVATSASSGYAAAPFPRAASSASAGQVTFQGVEENASLLANMPPHSPTTGQLSSPTSGPISISQVEQNYQQQCIKLMQQARQLVSAQNLPEALRLVEQVLHMAPAFTEALQLKAQLLGTTGRFQEAIPVTEQLLQIEPANGLAWSLYAALLVNTGRPQEALAAIDRALSLQPGNPEALAMRQSILSIQAAQMSSFPAGPQLVSPNMGTTAGTRTPQGESASSFFIAAVLQILAFILGLLGAAILVLEPKLPIVIGFALESFGLAALCILAARGSFRYGISRVLIALLLCLASAGVLAALYKLKYAALISKIEAFPPLIVPVIFLAIWLAAAAILPTIAAFGGLIGGLATGVRRK
jgi:tetratricopeptide (TPR) repeat protein